MCLCLLLKSVVFGDITLAFGASQFASVAIISVSSDEAATDSGRLDRRAQGT
jgi:hypothetical protein